MEDEKINLACLAFAIGQLHPNESAFYHVERIVSYVEAFNYWEKKNVRSLPNGWEGYTDQHGKDYEEVIYEWAKDIEL